MAVGWATPNTAAAQAIVQPSWTTGRARRGVRAAFAWATRTSEFGRPMRGHVLLSMIAAPRERLRAEDGEWGDVPGRVMITVIRRQSCSPPIAIAGLQRPVREGWRPARVCLSAFPRERRLGWLAGRPEAPAD